MTGYKKGDKVVISVPELGRNMSGKQLIMFSAIDNGGIPVDDKHILGKLEDFQPLEKKIKFTAEEKKEFDKLKDGWTGILRAFDSIVVSKYPKLYARLFAKPVSYKEQNKVLIEFIRAWGNPELIEVIEPEKPLVELNNGTRLQKDDDAYSISRGALRGFTLDEVKEAEEQLGIQGLQAKWHEAAKEARK